ncbi:ScyD/ScyE family protein [Pseudarthrobacter cellobiosi]|uniref:ScyD/ScyE family protein n=1 Tax=Pseudarthrobacter cellobiosi TaxID=2953654 RepID=UPI00208E3A95|nr:ScyD/ScyE family protein [Pseudarthrobacter sp. HLT1-5]MCO4255539.1 ScyD/ScyE family protein [Pseudarthrobacter sp. HLT1-5]
MNKKIPIIACLAAMLAIPITPASAGGSSSPLDDPLADGLGLPLSLAVGTNKSVLVTHTVFGEPPVGKLSRVDRDGSITDVYERPGWDVAGVETRGTTTFFLESTGAGGDPAALEGYLKAINVRGEVRTIAELASFERDNNPDGKQHYGFGPEVSDECLAGFPEFPPTRYTGIVDSHPYAAAVQGNTVFVADAGMNAILKVNAATGAVSTLAVLPPRPAVVPAGLEIPIDMMGNSFTVPECVVGHEYAFEPVPTDVELGPDGWLYVSSLPGGPEDESLGARGAIFRVNPWTGATHLWVEDILSPTGLAVSNTGDVYVASMFGNEILKISCWSGERSQFLAATTPAAVEIHGRTLYATVDALPDFTAPPPPASAGKVIKADIR